MDAELQVRIAASGREAEMSQEGHQAGPGREAIIEAAAWILLVLIILAILVFANLPCGGRQQISCRLLETLLRWTLRVFVFSLPLVIGFSLRRRTRSAEPPNERDRGDWHWLP